MGSKQGVLKVAARRIGMTAEDYSDRINAGEKWCTGCKAWHSRLVFNQDGSRGDGLSSFCAASRKVTERVSTKGRVSSFKGRTHTIEARTKQSLAKKGKRSPKIGIPRTPEEKANIRAGVLASPNTKRGQSHYAYRNGEHQRDRDDRRSVEYQQWREAVYIRDGYTCQQCGDAHGGNLQAHHIKPFASHPDLRYTLENGMTLCQCCHERLHLKPIPTQKDLQRRKKHTS